MIWRSIPLAYRILICVAIVVALAGGFFAWGYRWSGNAWALRYAEREVQLLQQTIAAMDHARGLEDQLDRHAADVDAAYQRGLTDARSALDRDLAALRRGSLRLRRDLAAAACRMSDPAPAAGSGDGEAVPRLWREAQEDLVRLAADADSVVRQLSACQGLLRIYARSPDGR